MKIRFTIVLILLFYSCSEKNIEKDKPFVFKPIIVKKIYTQKSGHEIEGYTHYLRTENYEENSDNFLIDISDKYRDTCTTNLPVWNIVFCKPFDFVPKYDSSDDELLRKHSIVRIGYQEETLHKKNATIGSITFYSNGQYNYIQLMTLDRMKNEGYYDSDGTYNRDWILDFDKKFNTHFSK